MLRLLRRVRNGILLLIDFLLNGLCMKLQRVELEDWRTLHNFRGSLFIRNHGRIRIMKDVRINSRYSANPIGGMGRTSFVVKDGGELLIDTGAGISNTAIVCWKSIYIGKNVRIGGDCKIYDTDFHSIHLAHRMSYPDKDVNVSPVRIEEGVFIGTGTIILKGVTIGRESVIGAGSVVASSVPEREIWAGNPARFIKRIPFE